MQYIYQVKKREFISKRGKNRLYSLCTFNKWKSGWLLQDLPSGPQKLGLVHFRVVVHTVTAPWARSGKVIGWEVGSQTPNSLMSFDLFPNGNGKRGTLVIILLPRISHPIIHFATELAMPNLLFLWSRRQSTGFNFMLVFLSHQNNTTVEF